MEKVRLAKSPGVELNKLFIRFVTICSVRRMAKVKDFMTKGVLTVDSRRTVADAAEVMRLKEVSSLVVTEGEKPEGIVTERDFVRRVVARCIPLDTAISFVMTTPLITIEPDASLNDAARKMIENRIRRLPVLEGNKLTGMIVVSDFARHLSEKTLTEKVLDALWHYPST